ncbi:MAG: glycosyltransferase family 2 protein [Nanoarchaeota archaeon]
MELPFLTYIIYFVSIFVGIFYLVVYFQNKNKLQSREFKEEPMVSIVVPAYNEEKNIPKIIESFNEIDYPKEKLELIMVDDGSKDNTYAIAKSFAGERIKVFTRENSGGIKAVPLNFGIKQAKGEIIVTLDADTFMQPDLLKKALSYFSDPSVAIVIPAVRPTETKGFLRRMQLIEYTVAAFSRKILTFIDSLSVAPAASVIKAEIFKKYGYYDEHNLTEDFELGLRVVEKHHKVMHVIDSYAVTEVPNNFVSLFKQRLRWNYGTFYNLVKYKRLFSPKYGDLGVFYLPLIVILTAFSVFVFVKFFFDIIIRLFRSLYLWSLSNFQIVFRDFHPMNFFTDPRILIGLFIMAISFFVFKLAKKHTGEKRVNIINYFVYLFVYIFFIIVFTLVALVRFIFRWEPKW